MAAASDASGDNNRLCQFSKTKMCKFHVLGKCNKGSQCQFAHFPLELRSLPDLRCTKLCKTLIQTGQCKSKTCMYAHSKEELRSQGAFHKTKLCRFMQTGHCSLGAKCNFAHSSVELREPEVISALTPPPGLGWAPDADEDDSAEGVLGLGGAAPRAARAAEDLPLSPGLKPAYVHLPPSELLAQADLLPQAELWTSCAASILEENNEVEDEPRLAAFEQAAGVDAWGFHDPLAAGLADFQLGDFGCYGPGGLGDFAYGSTPGEWSGYWGGGPALDPALDPYGGSLFAGGFGGAWDLPLFSDSVVIDQKDELQVKRSSAVKAAPKMRSVRTSESTLCTLADTGHA